MEDFKKGIAYHEAGHAALANVFNWPFDYVTVVESKERVGGVLITIPGKTVYKEYLESYPVQKEENPENRVLIRLAGYAVGKKLQSIGAELGANDDIERSKKLIKIFFGNEDTDKKLSEMKILAEKTVHKVEIWKKIKAIAEELLRRPTLKEEDIQKILSEL
jgi:ATP-dependent Zn protease